MVALGRAAEASLQERLVVPAAPTMERLVREQGGTPILTAPCGLEAIVLHTVEAEHTVRLSYAVYRRAPMHLGASGKVVAAWLEPAERERLIAAAGDPGLEATLEQVRNHGWVRTSGELDPGVSAVAAPVRDARGRILAGLSLAGPTARMADAGFAQTAAAVCEAARTIEAALAARDQ